jgi:predicted RNase H-like HicB family nuclease
MQKVKIVYWQDGDFWIGYLQDYPDYMTQGETFEELQENLKDIYDDIIGDKIPSARKVGELVVA